MKNLFNKGIIVIIMIGLIASIPLINERLTWEKTSNQVETVVDYDDLLILEYASKDPKQVEDDFFQSVKGQATSFAVNESTLERLKLKGSLTGDLWVYSGNELLEPTKRDALENPVDAQHTYVLFKDEKLRETYKPIFTQFFSNEGSVTDFEWNGLKGVEIAAPYNALKKLPLGIDPLVAEKMESYGFHIVPRLSNTYIDEERITSLFEQVAQFNPTYIVFQGDEVTGYPYHISKVAELMNKYHIGVGLIEMSKAQVGISSLSLGLAHYNELDKENDNWYITRVHPLSESALNRKIHLTLPQLKGEEKPELMDIQEQVELAVTERNIRLVYIHAPMPYTKHVSFEDSFQEANLKLKPEEIIQETKSVVSNVSNRIVDEGYTLGPAGPFSYQEKGWMSIARWLTLLGGIAVMSLLASLYMKDLKWILFILGVFGVIVAKILHLESLYFKFVALGTAVSVPTLAIYYSIMQLKDLKGKKVSLIHMLNVYLVTPLISLIGSWLVVGMLSHVKYSLYMDQFRGVSVLYLAPILLVAILVLGSYNQSMITILKGNFKNYYLIVLGVLGVVALYYVARSGNEATILPLEAKFRNLLQSGLDIRPRTKEFLFGYPIFVLAIYLAYYYKQARYLLIGAAMGQLSIVSTFTHLHTPYMVSVIRTLIGLGLGLVVGIILVIAWKVVEPFWSKILRRLGY